MSDTYVLVHGAWHTGAEIEDVAAVMREAGHTVHCPTIAGNRPGDDRAATGLADAIDSIVAFIEASDLKDIRLAGHSYGGMVISGVADRIAQRLKRLVYINAFVPLDGESLNDMVPPAYVAMFDAIAAAGNNAGHAALRGLARGLHQRCRLRPCQVGLRAAEPASVPHLHRQDQAGPAARRAAYRQVLRQLPAGHRTAAQHAVGIRACRRSSGSSGWWNAPGATRCSSRTRGGWRRRSWRQAANEPTPDAPAAPPPQGGAPGGPAKPVPRVPTNMRRLRSHWFRTSQVARPPWKLTWASSTSLQGTSPGR